MSSIFTGFETNELTFKASSGLKELSPVMLSSSSTVYEPEDGEFFCGVCSTIRNGYATIVLHGCATVRYSGVTPPVGYCYLATDGNGGVCVDNDNGRAILVVSIDESSKTLEILI